MGELNAGDARKVILDTDIGSDVDDALCLAYLLAQPRCDLLGITTVTGSARDRAKLASALCIAAGRPDVPIFPGLERPLIVDAQQTDASQARSLGPWEHRTDFPDGEAIEWMRQTIRSHPGEVDLLAIGPLTNVAALFTIDPEVPALLRSLVLMAGEFTTTYMRSIFGPMREWNVINDPHAAAIVFRDAPTGTRVLGFDVAGDIVFPTNEVRRRLTSEAVRPIHDWFEADAVFFPDPIAGVALFRDDLIDYHPGTIQVDLDSRAQLGATLWSDDPNGRILAGFSIDRDGFLEEYFSAFG
jgi:inosine-uridine nucleoside N-ribohydrolase